MSQGDRRDGVVRSLSCIKKWFSMDNNNNMLALKLRQLAAKLAISSNELTFDN